MCKEHVINFMELLDFFIKSRVILIREKIWNYYNHTEDPSTRTNLTLNGILDYLKNDLNHVIIFYFIFLKKIRIKERL